MCLDVYKQGNSTCDDICIGLAAGVTSSVVFLAVLTAILSK